VVELCQNWGIPLLRQAPTEPLQAKAGGEGLENAARKARYEFLHTAAKSVGARYLLTAHSADDQVETVLQRILRGTGIAGLGGIPRVRPLSEAVSVVRPLLTVRRSAIRAYLLDRNLPWCDDSSNVDPRFSRNRIRSELLPLLHEHYSRHVDESILRLSTLAREAQSIIDAQVEQLHVACARKSSTGDAVILKTNALRSATPYLVRELLIRVWKEHDWPLRDMTAERWDELATQACQQPSLDETLNLPGNIRVAHTGQTLVITPPPTRS
jgi:tRNA(Ile)-lysidine synthase